MLSRREYTGSYALGPESWLIDELDECVDRALKMCEGLHLKDSGKRCTVNIMKYPKSVVAEVCRRLDFKGWTFTVEVNDDREGLTLVIW